MPFRFPNLFIFPKKLLINSDFAILAAILFLMRLPYFQGIYIPRHDTLQVYQLFYFFYNLFLFQISLLLEELVLLAGMYVLAGLLFQRRLTVFIISLAAIFSTYWYSQIFFDLRMYYMFPWVLYFVILFFRKAKPVFLWLAIIITIFWLWGNGAYFISVWFFILALLSLCLHFQYPDAIKSLLRFSFLNIVLILFAVYLYGSYLYLFKDIFEFASIAHREASGVNHIDNFLSYGGGEEGRDQLMGRGVFFVR